MGVVKKLRPRADVAPLLYGGKSTEHITAIGMFGAYDDGTVRHVDHHGNARVLSESDIAEIRSIVLNIEIAARVWRNKLTGHNVVFVERRGNEIWATYRGKTERMMLMTRLRAARACTVCYARDLVVYLSEQDAKSKQLLHACICVPCVEKRSAVSRIPRLVGGPHVR